MYISEVETPALVVDLDIMERNLRRVAEYARAHQLRLRPHTKTHKSLRIARRQLELGAAGLTVAKVGEAEVMAETAPAGMLVAFPVVGRAKLERLMSVARRVPVTVALDDAEVARPLSEAAHAAGVEIGVLAETDVGLGRVGVRPGQPVLELARSIAKLPNLRFEGIAFYPGHIKEFSDAGQAAFRELALLVPAMLEDLRRASIPIGVVSGGSTPTLFHSHEIPGLTEIRPGTYVFNDLNTVRSGACHLEDCAATVLATVVSTARAGQIIIDGGSKTFSSDRLANPADAVFGHLPDAPEARFHKMNEEHGFIDVNGAARPFRIGDRVHLVPNHVCTAMNLHERVFGIRGGIRGGTVEEIWTVDARGKLQ